MSASDYLFFRTAAGQDLTTQVALASGATGSTGVVSARNSLSHVHVQQIRASQTTIAAATSITFRELDATGAIVGILYQTVSGPLTVGEQSYFLDFGPKGYKLAAGAGLFMVRASATGPGSNLVIEAYGTSSTGPLAIATTN
jgi:hypothetical protein